MQDALQAALAWKSLVVAAWFAFFFAAERVLPAADAALDEPSWRRLLRNAGLWAEEESLPRFLLVPFQPPLVPDGRGSVQ